MWEKPQFQPAQILYAPKEARFQPGGRCFQGIPSVERTAKGRLFACFYGGELEEQHGNYAVLAVSDDTGYTWTEPYLVVSHPDERMRVFDPCLWMDPLGRLWFTWSQSLGYFDGMHGVWASVCAGCATAYLWPATQNCQWRDDVQTHCAFRWRVVVPVRGMEQMGATGGSAGDGRRALFQCGGNDGFGPDFCAQRRRGREKPLL